LVSSIDENFFLKKKKAWHSHYKFQGSDSFGSLSFFLKKISGKILMPLGIWEVRGKQDREN